MTKFFITTVLTLGVIVMHVNAGLKPKGGLGETKPVDDEVTTLVDGLKSQIIEKICDSDAKNCPTSGAKIDINNYKTQTVSGTNYFVNFTIDGITYHGRIYSQPWTNTLQVVSVQGPKQATVEISYFELCVIP